MSDPVVYQSSSPRFGLPFLFAAQAQREFFVNEALARVDLLLHTVILGERSEPPLAPIEGEIWLVAPDAQGAWAGQSGRIAGFVAGDWTFCAPATGMRVWDKAHGQTAVFDGISWSHPAAPVAPAGGTVIDTEARAAILNLISSLRTAGIFSAN